MEKILIVGAPGSGKSTIARELARTRGIPHYFGTDTVREILRAVVDKEDHSTLHTSAILACDNTPDGENPMIWGFQQQAREVKPGIEAVLKRHDKEGSDVILEGIHLIPGYISGPNIKNFVINVPEELHLQQLGKQGDDRSPYKIDNFERARAFQDFLIDQALIHNAIVINHESLEQSVQQIMQSL